MAAVKNPVRLIQGISVKQSANLPPRQMLITEVSYLLISIIAMQI